jgi:K+ transporter
VRWCWRIPNALEFVLCHGGRGLLPWLVLLATAATVIASQAVITGAFSMARGAMQLGFLPRLRILHTAEGQSGQIYIGAVNWLLLVGRPLAGPGIPARLARWPRPMASR